MKHFSLFSPLMAVAVESAVCLFAVLSASSCARHQENHIAAEARKLFEKSCSAITLYTDSIRHAGDSVSVEELASGLDRVLTGINYEFAPDADLALTEQENDSLIHLLERFQHARRQSLAALNRQDSLENLTDAISKPPFRNPRN